MSVLDYAVTDQVAQITLNRPDRLNAFDPELAGALNDAIVAATEDETVRVVLLTGAGKGFSSGADLLASIGDSEHTLEDHLNEEFRPSLVGLMKMSKPVIAAVNGPVAGIGCAFVHAADLALMSEEAFMMLPFMNVALVPDGGICWHLAREIGHKRAFELAVSGERLPAHKCLELGLVNRVLPATEVLDAAKETARLLCRKAPIALRHTKTALRMAAEHSFDETFAFEARVQGQYCGRSKDFIEGVTAFREKREPRFAGE